MLTDAYLRLRSVGIWTLIVLVTFACALAAISLGWLLKILDPGRTIAHNIATFWAHVVIGINPLWSVQVFREHTIAPNTPYIIVANHQGMGDIIALYYLGCHFKWVAKESIFKVPIFGQAMHQAGYIAIRRGNKESARICLNQAKDWLNKNMPVFFFPEGTRSPDGKVHAFKDGAFRLAVETGIPLLPVAIQGSADLLPKHALVFRKAAPIRVKIGAPIPTKDYDSARLDELKALAQATVSSYVEELQKLQR